MAYIQKGGPSKRRVLGNQEWVHIVALMSGMLPGVGIHSRNGKKFITFNGYPIPSGELSNAQTAIYFNHFCKERGVEMSAQTYEGVASGTIDINAAGKELMDAFEARYTKMEIGEVLAAEIQSNALKYGTIIDGFREDGIAFEAVADFVSYEFATPSRSYEIDREHGLKYAKRTKVDVALNR